jgi:hypothetical protein
MDRSQLPARDARTLAGEGDIVWGGRQQKLTAPQRLWLDRMAGRGWTTPDWPQRIQAVAFRRLRPKRCARRW